MKNILKILPLALFSLSACEEVIVLELDSAEQRVVLEADLDAGKGACAVYLRKSGDFYQSNDFERISDADVFLRTPQGEQLLPLYSEGFYYLEGIQVQPGDTVSLRIQLADGQVINASPAKTPYPVSLDSLILEETLSGGPGPGGGNPNNGEKQFSLSFQWQDRAGSSDNYRLKVFRNGRYESEIYGLTDDRLGDGDQITRPIIRNTYAQGDTLRCQLLSSDIAYYNYFTDIANSDGRGFSSPTPYNPRTSLSGNALGYFGVWYLSEKIVVVR